MHPPMCRRGEAWVELLLVRVRRRSHGRHCEASGSMNGRTGKPFRKASRPAHAALARVAEIDEDRVVAACERPRPVGRDRGGDRPGIGQQIHESFGILAPRRFERGESGAKRGGRQMSDTQLVDACATGSASGRVPEVSNVRAPAYIGFGSRPAGKIRWSGWSIARRAGAATRRPSERTKLQGATRAWCEGGWKYAATAGLIGPTRIGPAQSFAKCIPPIQYVMLTTMK